MGERAAARARRSRTAPATRDRPADPAHPARLLAGARGPGQRRVPRPQYRAHPGAARDRARRGMVTMPGPTSYFDPENVGDLDPRTAALVRRRAAALGNAYRLFYREPLELVRGRGAHVWDRDGNEYLDVYNNVPSAGH